MVLAINIFFFRHPGDNPFYSNIDSMPEIRPIVRKPLGDFVSIFYATYLKHHDCYSYFMLIPTHSDVYFWIVFSF